MKETLKFNIIFTFLDISKQLKAYKKFLLVVWIEGGGCQGITRWPKQQRRESRQEPRL